MKIQLTAEELNHLRRLIGWVRCEIGQSPEEMMAMIKNEIAPICPDPSKEGKDRLALAYCKSEQVPLYVRAAVKSLSKVVKENSGEIVDGQTIKQVLLGTRA